MANSGRFYYELELYVYMGFILEWEIIKLHVKKNVVKYSCCM
jgi:hypothetical protein